MMRCKLKIRELGFLCFFLPIFVTKFYDITSSDFILQLVGVLSPLCFCLIIVRQTIPYRTLRFFVPFLLLSLIMIFTTGKQGLFISVLLVMAMYGINPDRCIYRICFYVGLFAFLYACFLFRDGQEIVRYVNGEWVTLIKRGRNVMGLGFISVVSLFLLWKRNYIKNYYKWIIFISGCIVSLYSGTRSILPIITVLLLITICFQTKLRKNRIFRRLCILTPLILFLVSYILTILYSEDSILGIIDLYFQGRIYQNYIHLNAFSPTLFGQQLSYANQVGEYWHIDCAYIDMYLQKGIVWLVLWIYLNCKTIQYMYNKERFTEVSILIMYAFYGLSEDFIVVGFINMSYFIFADYIYGFLLTKRHNKTRRLQYQLN